MYIIKKKEKELRASKWFSARHRECSPPSYLELWMVDVFLESLKNVFRDVVLVIEDETLQEVLIYHHCPGVLPPRTEQESIHQELQSISPETRITVATGHRIHHGRHKYAQT